ncbi:MAG: transcriptional regulator GlxA family with amidase domain [Parasphingorhabdus sp.]|jgi:transcriptional regulator GlxA family with amidase domain
MKVAFVVYDNMTSLDFIGIYDPLTRIKSMGFDTSFNWKVCALTPKVTDDRGLGILVDCVGESLEKYDLLIMPGGPGAVSLQDDEIFIRWIKTANSVPIKASVCSGSLILASANFLQGRIATTHPGVREMLSDKGVKTSSDRIVEDDNVITAAGVTAAIDLGLYIV